MCRAESEASFGVASVDEINRKIKRAVIDRFGPFPIEFEGNDILGPVCVVAYGIANVGPRRASCGPSGAIFHWRTWMRLSCIGAENKVY